MKNKKKSEREAAADAESKPLTNPDPMTEEEKAFKTPAKTKNRKKKEIGVADARSKPSADLKISVGTVEEERDVDSKSFPPPNSKVTDSKSVDTPIISISNKNEVPGVVSQTPNHEEEGKEKGEVEDEKEEVEEDPILERCATFIMDKADSLNYHQLEDNEQP